MLLWLQQRLPKKNIFLFKLSVFSALLHLMFCSFFFMYKEYHHSLLLQVHSKHNPDNVIVRLLPISAKKPSVRMAKRVGVVKKKIVKKAAVKKNNMQLAHVAKPKPKIKPKPVAKPEQKKKIEVKALEKKEKPKVEKIEVKPVEKLKPEVTKKDSSIQSPKVANQDVPEIKKIIKNEPLVEQAEENVRYVTHKELRGVELENAVQAAVQEVWSPPVGVDQEVVSQVLVTVGWDGKLVESKILKLSDIVIYDVAVQEALEEITFPRQIWGKQVKIAFRP